MMHDGKPLIRVPAHAVISVVIVELADGRIAIVEYKGSHLASDPHEILKRDIGELWARQSGGKAVFVRVVDRDWTALDALVASA